MQRIEKCLAGCGRERGDLLRASVRAALKAGAILRDLYGKPHQIKHKGTIDLVTEADVAAEKAILAILGGARPEAAMLAEESHARYGAAPVGPTWIIDPLDGTTNFAHGFPWFGVSIAYAEGGKSLTGVIYCPMQEELFCAVAGAGAWLNGEPIHVSAVEELQQSLMATGFPYAIEENRKKVIAALEAVLPRVQGVRRAGAAALDMAYVACGRLDGFWEIHLKPWDTAAGLVLVEEAGGLVTEFKGSPFSPFVPEILVSNGLIHRRLVALLERFSETG